MKPKKGKKMKNKGFNLIELIIVIAILGLLIAIAVPVLVENRETIPLASTDIIIDYITNGHIEGLKSYETTPIASIFSSNIHTLEGTKNPEEIICYLNNLKTLIKPEQHYFTTDNSNVWPNPKYIDTIDKFEMTQYINEIHIGPLESDLIATIKHTIKEVNYTKIIDDKTQSFILVIGKNDTGQVNFLGYKINERAPELTLLPEKPEN